MSDKTWSVIKGALIAAAGAAAPYLLDLIQILPLGPLSPIVGAVAAVIVNAIRKALEPPTP